MTTSSKALLLGAALCAGLSTPAVVGQDGPAPFKRFHVGGLELSGVAKVEGGFLFVDDEAVGMAMFLPEASFVQDVPHHVAKQLKFERRRKSSRPFTDNPRLIAIQDLEDLASDGEEMLYVLASHAGRISGSGAERRTDREAIVRVEWRPRSGELRVRSPEDGKGKEGVYTGLIEAMAKAAPKSVRVDGFINAEGLALKGKKDLFVGLRHPLTPKGEALVFTADADAFFGDEKERKGVAKLGVLRLALGGSAVRGLHWDRGAKRLLIIGGPSVDGSRGFGLWSCKADGSELKQVHEFTSEFVKTHGSPEGIARLDAKHVLIACDREGTDLGGVYRLPLPQ